MFFNINTFRLFIVNREAKGGLYGMLNCFNQILRPLFLNVENMGKKGEKMGSGLNI